jgi:ubiquinone/menaquinone biosynthesis C-methylase UbiE
LNKQVALTVGDADRLAFADGSFDRVDCSRVLLHLERPETAVAEMARAPVLLNLGVGPL